MRSVWAVSVKRGSQYYRVGHVAFDNHPMKRLPFREPVAFHLLRRETHHDNR